MKQTTPKKIKKKKQAGVPELLRGRAAAQKHGGLEYFLLETSPEPVVICDKKGKVTTVNAAFEQVFGWTLAEVSGKRLALQPALDQAQAEPCMEQLARAGTVTGIEAKYSAKDGKIIDVHFKATIITGKSNKITGILIILQDVTNRQKKVLDEAQRRMTDIINFLPDAVMVIDHQGQVLIWNRAMEALTNVQAADILGKGNYEYALPFYGERRPILVDLVLLSHEESEQKYTYIQRAGEILCCICWCMPHRG